MHTSSSLLRIIRDLLPGHLVSLGGDIKWPLRSPDLTPCDFFLSGHVKSQVYQHRPANLQELKAAITHEINAIPQDMVDRAMINFRDRLLNSIDIGGRHSSDIIFENYLNQNDIACASRSKSFFLYVH